ncbi:hypothetical protein [Paraflavitalea pollutisoli]|uniref:hypothetical protein n=1 Tax=Paraflavitalea pollutisoli TaxID=3034143 RepID=UPI0023EB01BA|nr:hypothetical protein [Paraflavitalea sp. H1-2-19X]
MKKVSISGAALLAVVIAVASAFTTAKPTITEGWYLAQPGTALGTPPANPPGYTYTATAFPIYHGLTSPNVAVGQCASNPTQLCSAYFNATPVNVRDPQETIFYKAGGRQ